MAARSLRDVLGEVARQANPMTRGEWSTLTEPQREAWRRDGDRLAETLDLLIPGARAALAKLRGEVA